MIKDENWTEKTIFEFSLDDSLEVIFGSNTINFGEVSAEGGEVESTTLTVSSSLPYDISTKAYTDFVGDNNSNNIIPIEKLSLGIDDNGYLELSKNKILNLGENPNSVYFSQLWYYYNF